MIPKDPMILLSYVNTKLRDQYPTLEDFCKGENADPEEEDDDASPGGRLPADKMRSLMLILVSVALWYMGYNAVTTAYSTYFTRMWGDLSGAASCLMIATGGAVVSYVPVGMLSSVLGRKRMILIGVALLAVCFAVTGMISTFGPVVYALFVLVGKWNDWFTGMLYIDNPKLVPVQTMLTRIQQKIDFIKNNSDMASTPDGQRMLMSMPTEQTRMAILVLSTLPIIFAYPFFQRYFIQGLTIGSVKG